MPIIYLLSMIWAWRHRAEIRAQPDFGAALIATAVSGVLWAVFRLGVAYTGDSGQG